MSIIIGVCVLHCISKLTEDLFGTNGNGEFSTFIRKIQFEIPSWNLNMK